jgi:hypothetical protein
LSSTSSVSRSASHLRTSSVAERVGDRRRDHQRVGHGHEVDVPHTVGELIAHLGGDAQGEACLADPARPDGRDQALLTQCGGQRHSLGQPSDERRQRRRQPGSQGDRRGGLARRTGVQDPGDTRQRAAIIRLQFAQQRGDVALDGADGDGEPRADLGVGQMFAECGQDLGLAGRDVRGGRSSRAVHVQIVP